MSAGVFVGKDVVVVMDPAPVVFVNVFHTGSGPDRHIKDKANEVATLAKALAPKRTGRLAASIRVDPTRHSNGRFGFGYNVIAHARYAVPVHEGADPHIMVSAGGFGTMKFMGTNAFAGNQIS